MKRLTKAALATSGAALLLLGGAHTLAYWTTDAASTGTGVSAGTLTMSGGACDDWRFSGGQPVAAGIVPGDVLTTTCTMAVGGTGDRLALGEITVSEPTWTADNALTGALDVRAVGAALDGAVLALPLAEPVPLSGSGSDELTITVQATFDAAAGNDTQGLLAALDEVTVQVTQAHVAS